MLMMMMMMMMMAMHIAPPLHVENNMLMTIYIMPLSM